MERTKETKNPNKPCAQSGQSDITREQGAQAQSEEMVTISRTKLNQLATLAEKGLESEKRDGLLDRVDTILSGKTPSVSRSTQTQSFNTNKVDIDALLKQRLQAMSDEDLAKMNITRSQTPETQATVQQKGDTSGTSGTQGGNNQQNTQPSVPGYNDVKEYYYRNFARMPNQEEIQLHCVEGVPLPNYETVVQNVGQNIQAGVN